jgi:hypothetical protein
VKDLFRRSCNRLQCSPPAMMTGVILFITLAVSADPLRHHARGVMMVLREAGAVLLVAAGAVIVISACRAVSKHPVTRAARDAHEDEYPPARHQPGPHWETVAARVPVPAPPVPFPVVPRSPEPGPASGSPGSQQPAERPVTEVTR